MRGLPLAAYLLLPLLNIHLRLNLVPLYKLLFIISLLEKAEFHKNLKRIT